MQEFKVGDKITISVEIRKIIEDKDGKHYDVRKVGTQDCMNTIIVEPKDIVE